MRVAQPLLLAAAMLLIALPSLAADFRFLDFGDSCSEVVSRERSVRASLESHEHGSYRFSGWHSGHPVSIRYECPNGHFVRGLLLFRFTDFEAAKGFFNQQKPEFIAIYGVPQLDQGSPLHTERMQALGFDIREEHKYLLGWELGDKNILLGASAPADKNAPALVSIDIAPSQRDGDGAHDMPHH